MSEEDAGGRGAARRRVRIVAVLALALAASVAGCRMMTNHLVARADRVAQRDPETGVLLGAEARDLGPADAGRAALFVHGFVGSGQNFADLPDRLAERGWRVRVMRLPGHGTSPLDVEEVSADTYMEAVEREARGLAEAHARLLLVGHSMGGALAGLAAARTPAAGLALLAPYYGVTHRWYYGLTPESWLRIGRFLLRWTYKGELFMQVNRPEAKGAIQSYQWVPVKALLTLAEVGRRAADPDALAAITCPVLLVHSRGDVAASPDAAAEAFERMGAEDKQAVWFDRSNHHLLYDYDREEVAQTVLAFADRVAAAAPTPPAAAAEPEKEPAMSYTIRRVDAPPSLEGPWDGPGWRDAETLTIGRFRPEGSDHKPHVQARILYDDAGLYVGFRVEDTHVLAQFTDYQDPVCRDSCVEFFVQPRPDRGYFNFEVNCIGTMLLHYTEASPEDPSVWDRVTPVPEAIGKTVEIRTSLSGPITPERVGPQTWTVFYHVPFAVFEEFVGPLGPPAGQTWRGNLYKCADDSEKPHWASWAPIGEPLSFHCPERFAPLRFAP